MKIENYLNLTAGHEAISVPQPTFVTLHTQTKWTMIIFSSIHLFHRYMVNSTKILSSNLTSTTHKKNRRKDNYLLSAEILVLSSKYGRPKKIDALFHKIVQLYFIAPSRVPAMKLQQFYGLCTRCLARHRVSEFFLSTFFLSFVKGYLNNFF